MCRNRGKPLSSTTLSRDGGRERDHIFVLLLYAPLTRKKRNVLCDSLKNDHLIRVSKMSPNEIFLFLINPPCEKPETQNLIARRVWSKHGLKWLQECAFTCWRPISPLWFLRNSAIGCKWGRVALRGSSRVPVPQTFSRRLWSRNAWRTPKNVCVGG